MHHEVPLRSLVTPDLSLNSSTCGIFPRQTVRANHSSPVALFTGAEARVEMSNY
jgi:hypothetical protein